MGRKAVYFISADDEFVALNRAREIFDELSADVVDDMSKEIVDGAVSKADDAVSACFKTFEAAATISMFGGKKVVWLKGANFISRTPQGNSTSVKEALEKLAEALSKLNPDEAAVVISASPVDKTRSFVKKMKEIAECEDFSTSDKNRVGACAELVGREARIKKIPLDYGAAETLAETVAGNTRMAIQELEKLAAYTNCARPITPDDVAEMVPIFGEGVFFDIANAFYAGNLDKALAALKRFFFANKNASARQILSSLQRQNSQLIVIRALMENGDFPKSTYPVSPDTIADAASKYAELFSEVGSGDPYNVFAQNAWLIGKQRAPIAGKFSLKKLIDFQMRFEKAFEDLISRPNSDAVVMRDLFVLCMSK